MVLTSALYKSLSFVGRLIFLRVHILINYVIAAIKKRYSLFNKQIDVINLFNRHIISGQDKDDYGECQLEVDFRDECDLQERFKFCPKNPKHKNFVSLKSLNPYHLPEGHRTKCALEYIQHVAQFTVKLTVRFTSLGRACTCGNKHLAEGRQCECIRGKRVIRAGSGFVTGLADPDQLNPYVIDATKTYFILVTAAHVIFDTSEAQKTTIEFFYDDPDDRSSVRKARGVKVLNTNFDADFSEVLCVTEEKEVAEMLKYLNFTRLEDQLEYTFLKEKIDNIAIAIYYECDEAFKTLLKIMKEEGFSEVIECLRDFMHMHDAYLEMQKNLEKINKLIPRPLPPLPPPHPLVNICFGLITHAIYNKYEEACKSLLKILKKKGHSELMDSLQEFIPLHRHYNYHKDKHEAYLKMERILEKINELIPRPFPLLPPIPPLFDYDKLIPRLHSLLPPLVTKRETSIPRPLPPLSPLDNDFKKNIYFDKLINESDEACKPFMTFMNKKVQSELIDGLREFITMYSRYVWRYNECAKSIKSTDFFVALLKRWNRPLFSEEQLESAFEESVHEDLAIHISHPHGTSKKVTFGNIVSADTRNGHYLLIYSLDTCKGSSGGPVFVIPSNIYTRSANTFRFDNQASTSISCVPHSRHHGNNLNSSSSWTEYF